MLAVSAAVFAALKVVYVLTVSIKVGVSNLDVSPFGIPKLKVVVVPLVVEVTVGEAVASNDVAVPAWIVGVVPVSPLFPLSPFLAIIVQFVSEKVDPEVWLVLHE